MGHLDKNNRKFLAEILYGFIQRDYVKVAEVHFQAGLVPQEASNSSLKSFSISGLSILIATCFSFPFILIFAKCT